MTASPTGNGARPEDIPAMMPIRVAAEATRLEFDADRVSAAGCPNCRAVLTLHQPDKVSPDLLLAVCRECRHWLLIDVFEGVVVRLSARQVLRDAGEAHEMTPMARPASRPPPVGGSSRGTESPEVRMPDPIELVDRARHGDRQAHLQLFYLYKSKAEHALKTVLRRHPRLRSYSEDLHNEAMLLLWSRLPRFDVHKNHDMGLFCYHQVYMGLLDYVALHAYRGLRRGIRARKSAGRVELRNVNDEEDSLLNNLPDPGAEPIDDLIDLGIDEDVLFEISSSSSARNRHVSKENIVDYIKRRMTEG